MVKFIHDEFADNPDNRCACVLLLDTSSTMSEMPGMSRKPIDELNKGLEIFYETLNKDALSRKRVEVAIVSFGPVEVVQDFVTARDFEPPRLVAEGRTPMGEAVLKAIDMVSKRKETYRTNGIEYYRP
ncbi:hypothetical protein FACS189475_01000 [Betaproteobacteria bacterium]|nr:hypothetical protein FACS189475_01000 [Betaproteobacteria bacterium]